MFDLSFFNKKRVFLTGHTGFKGTWLSRILINAGAVVVGYSLDPLTKPSLYELSGNETMMKSIIADIRDYDSLRKVFDDEQPEIVFHLAAQPIVREGYSNPEYTYETNVMGTVILLECIRHTESVKTVVNITTDKVYRNNEWERGYREDDILDGFDPYSNSKSCSELVTASYVRSFFSDKNVAISTARAGNVIGGGDFSKDRIIPDCIRAVMKGEKIGVRNPKSIRPYQHVLEPLAVYLMIAQKQYEDSAFAGNYNIGPDDEDCVTTEKLVNLFCNCWGAGAQWEDVSEIDAPHEAGILKLDCSKLKDTFGWSPKWHIEECMEKICRFSKIWLEGGDVSEEMDLEIKEFLEK